MLKKITRTAAQYNLILTKLNNFNLMDKNERLVFFLSKVKILVVSYIIKIKLINCFTDGQRPKISEYF